MAVPIDFVMFASYPGAVFSKMLSEMAGCAYEIARSLSVMLERQTGTLDATPDLCLFLGHVNR
jgi:hypothetical protein